MTKPNQPGAGEPGFLNLRPIYQFDENPHSEHKVHEVGTRQASQGIWFAYWCDECLCSYIVFENWEHLQKRHPEGNYLRE